jgi:hypothetical protein
MTPIRLPITVREVVTREIELSPDDIEMIRSWMAEEFLSHIEYGVYNSRHVSDSDRAHIEFCKKFGVDPHVDTDRVEFFKAVVERVGL